MLQRILSLFYLGTSFALGLFILVHVAQKDDVGAGLGAFVLTAYVAIMYLTQRAARKRKQAPAVPRSLPREKAS